jgi:CRP-like cAMP-binding protein
MAIDALIAPLLRVEIFQGLTPLQITEIARRAERIVFRPGSKITEAGKDAEAAFLIVGGAAECLSVDDDGLPEAVEEASLIGEMAMLIEHSYGATVLARGNVRCLKISRSEMHEQMLDDPALAEALSANITARLTRVAQELRAIDRDVAMSDYISTGDVAQTIAH